VKLIVIGCGRVGSTIAKRFAADGWDVTAVDENESALSRLGENWTGGFVRGHGMDNAVLREAGIEDADAVVVSTDGDNTNLVIGQVARSGSASTARSSGSSTRRARTSIASEASARSVPPRQPSTRSVTRSAPARSRSRERRYRSRCTF